jgi:hypothetical protein
MTKFVTKIDFNVLFPACELRIVRDELKVRKVIESCVTIEQLQIAHNYMESYEKRYKISYHTNLHRLWRKRMGKIVSKPEA